MIYTVPNRLFPSNTYLVVDVESNESVIIDPGLDHLLIDNKLTEIGSTPVGIISTHGHFDHIGGSSFLKKKYDIPFYLHEGDSKLSRSANFFLKMAKINLIIDTPTPDVLLTESFQVLDFKQLRFEIYNFPGHTIGSCVIKYQNNLFTGDLLYKKGLGINHLPGENLGNLKESIKSVFSIFPKETQIYPGHGKPETLGNIKSHNRELVSFLEESNANG